MKKIDLYLAQAISIKGENGTSYEQVTHIDTTKEGDEYIEDKNGEILFFNEMDATMRLNALEAIEQAEEKRVRVLCYCDTADNTKGVLLVTKIDGSLWEKRQAIDNAIRCAFYDQYEAEGVHPADEDEDEFEQVLDKLAAGQNADLYEYEIFWENTVMV